MAGVTAMNETQAVNAPQLLAAIVESSDDAILSKDLNGVVQSCNAAAEHIFGYAPSELIGRSVRVLIPTERQAEEDDILARIRRGERVRHFETVRVSKDQRRIDVSLTISPVRDAAGVVIGASKIARDITEQKRARAIQAHLAAIVESAEDGILSKDLDGIVQSCNTAAERLFGYAASELVGRSVRVLIPPDRQSEEDAILTRIRRGERIQHFETVRMAKDGRRLDVSLSVSPVRQADGTIVAVAKSVRDITEQKRLVREIAQQQEWFRVTLGSIGDGVIASDPDGRVTYLNRHAEALTGWTADAATGRPLADVFRIVNESTRLPVTNPSDLVLRSGRVAELANHTVLISCDGTERSIADSAAPIRDAAGRIIGVVLVFRDVTEARQAEAALAEQREWFETTLRSIGDAVIATDAQGLTAFMNPVAERLTGWTLGAARGRDCAEIFRIVDQVTRRAVVSPVARALTEGVVVSLGEDAVLIAADGTECPIDDSAAPIRSRDGRVIGAVLVFRDITDRRRAEAERRDGERRKDEFLAVLAHELRGPLAPILTAVALLKVKWPADPELQKLRDTIQRQTLQLSKVVEDLLDVGRVTAGKLHLQRSRIDLRDVVQQAVEVTTPVIEQRGHVLSLQVPDVAVHVDGDAARLVQVAGNLLHNAAKFTPNNGRIEVVIGKESGMAVMAVRDNGIGIPPQMLDGIFNRFVQIDTCNDRPDAGLGIGLSVVKALIELHGGAVEVRSAGVGKGSEFIVRVPMTAQ
jgi:PAS domain S-box-containing protein